MFESETKKYEEIEDPGIKAFRLARNMSVPARTSFDATATACAALAHHGTLP